MLLFFRLGTEMYILYTKHLNKANLLAMNHHHQHRHRIAAHFALVQHFYLAIANTDPNTLNNELRAGVLHFDTVIWLAAHHYALSIRKQAIIVFWNFQPKWYLVSCVLFHSQ